MKDIFEIVKNYAELCKFINNGKITFDREGVRGFYKTDYKLEKDIQLSPSYYKYKPRTKVKKHLYLKAGTVVKLVYEACYERYIFTFVYNHKGQDYCHSVEQLYKCPRSTIVRKLQELLPDTYPDFNELDNFYAYILDGVVKLSN